MVEGLGSIVTKTGRLNISSLTTQHEARISRTDLIEVFKIILYCLICIAYRIRSMVGN